MKKISALILFVLPLFAFASYGDTLKFWVQFTDKKNSPYSIKQPETFLSKKAIERRAKFGIVITEEDFPVNPDYLKKVTATGVQVLNTSRWLNGVSIQTADNAAIKTLMALPFVKGIEKVGVYDSKDNSRLEYLMEMLMAVGEEAPETNDGTMQPAVELTPYNKEYYGKGFNQIEMLNGAAMHRLGLTGKGVTIAVLDGGFMNVNKIKTFQHLYTNGQLLGTWDFVRQDSNVYDDNNHGMNVLSCMAARTPGKMVGTAPDASYWLLRTEDANTEFLIEEYNWVSGAEFADSAGVDIINSSLGYSTFDDNSTSHKYKQLDGKTSVASRAAGIAAQKGIIVCNAAGNEGNDEWTYIGAPADAEGILTVGGVNADSTFADFSSYGPTADGRLKPEVTAQATQAYVATVADVFVPNQGTSFASPILCGMVACLRQANPNKTVQEIIAALQLSGHRFANPDTAFGNGIPNFVRANRYLGNDAYFDYNKNSIETAPPKTFNKAFGVIVYLTKKQKIDARLNTTAGQTIRTFNTQGFEKGFNKVVFTELDGLKPGTYQIEIKIGGATHGFTLTKD